MDDRTPRLNAAQISRLEGLALTEDAFVLPLVGGWTVGVALAHLAFWEALDASLMRGWARGLVPPVEPAWYAEPFNEVLLPAWQLLPGRQALRLALEAMHDCDAVVAELGDAIVRDMRARNEMWYVRRYLHRREHLAQIEAALEHGLGPLGFAAGSPRGPAR